MYVEGYTVKWQAVCMRAWKILVTWIRSRAIDWRLTPLARSGRGAAATPYLSSWLEDRQCGKVFTEIVGVAGDQATAI